MATIVAYTDFQAGSLKLSMSSFQQTDMAAYIATYENKFLRELLTDKLQAEIAAASSLTGKYAALINGCNYTDAAGNYRTNDGLKQVLLRFIYYQYCADNFQPTTVGKTQNQNENAAKLPEGVNTAVLYKKYNEGVDIWNTDITSFLYEFQQQEKTVVSYTDLGSSCRIFSTDTGYLQDGDTVYLNGAAYVVSNLVANTSFDIPGTGLTPSGDYTFYPFEDVVIAELEYAY